MNHAPHYRTISVNDRRDGAPINVFYREAGPNTAPAVLLLHGFPSSSHQYRGLIDRLSGKYRVIAPDLPGFGFSDAPDAGRFAYTFEHLAEIIEDFTDAVGLQRYALYVFDYGAPIGFRLAVSRPDRIAALITQNGNAYEEGLSDGWAPIRAYWNDPSVANREALRGFLTLETTRFQYQHGEADPTLIAPESYGLDQHMLDLPGRDTIQLDLLGDYRTNVAAYPQFQAYFRAHQPPTLAVWGRNDPFFLPEGALAFQRDMPKAEVRFVDGGHFVLETHLDEVASTVVRFLSRVLDTRQGPALFGALTEADAPAEAAAHFDTMRAVFGFVPTLGYAIAAEPGVLGVYLAMLQALGQTQSLDPIAQQVALVAVSHANAADYGVAVHATLAGKLGASRAIVEGMRRGDPLPDARLEAVRRFATALTVGRTQVSDADVTALLDVGYDRRAVVAIALAAASKTLVNTVAQLSHAEIDAAFLPAPAT